jgi:hypothetical protein
MATYDDTDRWTPLQRAMALSVAQTVGTLPQAKLPPLNGPGPERETLRLPLVKVRSLVSNRYGPDGKCVEAGQLLELRADEALGWIQHSWAAAEAG